MTAVINNGICRCCATEGTFKDLKSKYHWMGDEEIYADMLKDCFDIGLLLTEESESSGICEVCITQLRNAANFKRQVLHTEEQFKSHINSKAFKEGQPSFVKIEVPLQDEGNSDTDIDNDIFSEDCNTEFEVPIKREKVETKAKKRATRSSASSAKKVKLEGETSKQDELHCEICESTFTNTYNLKRHTLNLHGLYQDSTKKRLCDGCGKIFFNDKWLKRHLAIGCPGKDGRMCTECDVTFDKQEDMLKHVRRMHWARRDTLKLKCHLCDEVLNSHEEHDSHLLNEHWFKLEYEDYTFDCAEDFKQWKQAMENKQDVIFVKRNLKDGYYYHCFPKSQLGRTRVRPKDNFCPARINVVEELGLILVTCQSKHSCKDVKRVDRKQLACSACDDMFIKYEDMHEHLVSKHQVEIVVEELKFCSFQDFQTWKSKVEREAKINFFKRSSVTTANGVEKTFYHCGRSGKLRTSATKKCLNKQSSKSGKDCPARIVLVNHPTDGYQVTYQKTHFGHDHSAEHLKLTKEERSDLARRIQNGVSLTDIINDCRKVTDTKLKDLRKIDLYNVIRDFNIDKSSVNYGRK